MNSRKSTIDIIGEVIESLDVSVKITGYINEGSGLHTIQTCNMKYAQPGFEVTIGANKYKILDIEAGENAECGAGLCDVIKIKGPADAITETSFDLYRPFFFYGTPIQQGTENKDKQASDKTPMFWLNWGTLKNKYYHDETDNKDRDVSMDLYALTQSSHEAWVTDQFKRYAVDPMERMMQMFTDKAQQMSWLFDQYSMTESIEYMGRFGVYITNKGFKDSLWTDKLSGVHNSASYTLFRNEGSCESCLPGMDDMVIEETFVVS